MIPGCSEEKTQDSISSLFKHAKKREKLSGEVLHVDIADENVEMCD